MTNITHSEPRTTVRVTLPNGTILEGPLGTTTGEFLRVAEQATPLESPLMGCICDGQLRELSYPLQRDAVLAPVLLNSSDGGRIYRRSLVLLVVTAATELWPDIRLSVRYAVPDGGFYCTRLNGPPFTPHDLEKLDQHMRKIVEADDPITKRIVPLEEAEQLFTQRNEHDKVRLLEQRIRPELTLYSLRNQEDYYFGYMLPSTTHLKYFRLIWVRDGFIIQYPRRETTLRPLRAYNKLTEVFRQADDWLRRMDIEDIGRLNQVVKEPNRIHELILVAEAFHEQQIAHIARQIYQRHHDDHMRLVLIAGPSSSGKTTFAKRLSIQLLASGLRPLTLELDNYFVDRALTPLTEAGDYNFEALHAINLPLFNQHLLQLINGEQVQTPRFDFITGKSVPGRIVQLQSNQIIIIEGIHGLNPELIADIPLNLVYRIYVSALTQLNIDAYNRVPTTDVRLLRRIARDARTRGYSATDTLNRWGSVRDGEKTSIFPFQENADSMFNSALVYELATLRPLVEPLLLQVEPNTPPHIEAKRLLSFLSWVYPMPPDCADLIPDTSLLREFIGGSSLEGYHPTPESRL